MNLPVGGTHVELSKDLYTITFVKVEVLYGDGSLGKGGKPESR